MDNYGVDKEMNAVSLLVLMLLNFPVVVFRRVLSYDSFYIVIA